MAHAANTRQRFDMWAIIVDTAEPSAGGRRLRRDRALARKAEPRLRRLLVDSELRRAELHDLQRRLDRGHRIARAPSRRAFLPSRAFGAADETQPHAVFDELGR